MHWTSSERRLAMVDLTVCTCRICEWSCRSSDQCVVLFSNRIMDSNSFLCDCQLQWLPGWLLIRGLQSDVNATCAHPLSVKGMSVFEAPPSSFMCGESGRPLRFQWDVLSSSELFIRFSNSSSSTFQTICSSPRSPSSQRARRPSSAAMCDSSARL